MKLLVVVELQLFPHRSRDGDEIASDKLLESESARYPHF